MKKRSIIFILILLIMSSCSNKFDSNKYNKLSEFYSPYNKIVFTLYETIPEFLDPADCIGTIKDEYNEKETFFQYRGSCTNYVVSWIDETTIRIYLNNSDFDFSIDIFKERLVNGSVINQ